MKRIIILSLLIFICSISSWAQKDSIKISINFIDTIIKKPHFRETGIKAIIENISDKNLYLPNTLMPFDYQLRDSIYMVKLSKNDNNTKIGAFSGNSSNAHVSGVESYVKKYYNIKFNLKKELADSIINSNEITRGKKNFNPLFLKSGEKFPLYFITPIYFDPYQEGKYKLVLKINSKEKPNAPDLISSYHQYNLDNLETKPIFFSVINTKAGKNITFRDSRNKKIKTIYYKAN
jgi:hypothetical protein